jgi:sugar/nucleoside kinase (ribokinase family)
MSLLIIGTMAFDAIETPFGKTDKIIGGAATYIGLAASNLYKNINTVSVVGEDFPADYMQLLRNKSINLEGVQVKEGENSFFWSGKYSKNLNERETLITELNVLEHFDPIIPASYAGAEYVMLGNLTPAVQKTVLNRLTTKPKLTVLDTMNFWMDIAMDDLLDVIKDIDVLVINDEEARQLSGEYFLSKAAEKIFTMGPKYLIIKKGEHGALLMHEDKIFSAPALLLNDVKDPTGAGDSFAGGFIGYLAKTNDLRFENMKKAVVYGSACASFCVQEFGTDGLMNITQESLARRINEFRTISEF